MQTSFLCWIQQVFWFKKNTSEVKSAIERIFPCESVSECVQEVTKSTYMGVERNASHISPSDSSIFDRLCLKKQKKANICDEKMYSVRGYAFGTTLTGSLSSEEHIQH